MVGWLYRKTKEFGQKKKKVYIRKCNHVNTLYKTGTIWDLEMICLSYQVCSINLIFYFRHLAYRFSLKFTPVRVAFLMICCIVQYSFNNNGKVSEESSHIFFTWDNDLHYFQGSIHLQNTLLNIWGFRFEVTLFFSANSELFEVEEKCLQSMFHNMEEAVLGMIGLW